MPTRAVYGSDGEWLEWELRAGVRGESVNGWVRRSLVEAAALERALEREGEVVEGGLERSEA